MEKRRNRTRYVVMTMQISPPPIHDTNATDVSCESQEDRQDPEKRGTLSPKTPYF